MCFFSYHTTVTKMILHEMFLLCQHVLVAWCNARDVLHMACINYGIGWFHVIYILKNLIFTHVIEDLILLYRVILGRHWGFGHGFEICLLFGEFGWFNKKRWSVWLISSGCLWICVDEANIVIFPLVCIIIYSSWERGMQICHVDLGVYSYRFANNMILLIKVCNITLSQT